MMSTKHKILVVDDEIGHLRLLEKIILDLGFKVITAIDGLDGLEKLKDNQPISVILSDHNMPNIEGNAFLSMAKGISPRSQRIMITALRDPEMMEKSINKGEVFRFLHKPVEIEGVKEIVKKAVHIYEQQLLETEESLKKDRTIRSLFRKLDEKPVSEKALIFSFFLLLGILAIYGSPNKPPPEKKLRTEPLQSSLRKTSKNIHTCLESAESYFFTCTSEIEKQKNKGILSVTKANRRKASCESMLLQRKTICESRFNFFKR